MKLLREFSLKWDFTNNSTYNKLDKMKMCLQGPKQLVSEWGLNRVGMCDWKVDRVSLVPVKLLSDT